MTAELHLVGLAKFAFCILLFGAKAFVAACAVLLALWLFGCRCRAWYRMVDYRLSAINAALWRR